MTKVQAIDNTRPTFMSNVAKHVFYSLNTEGNEMCYNLFYTQ